MTITRPALRYHGGKFRLAPWLLRFLPPHRCYVEPFGGAASLLLRKPRSYAEVYNDLFGELVEVFRVLRDRSDAAELERRLQLTPFARVEFEAAYEDPVDRIDGARQTIVRSFMGFGAETLFYVDPPYVHSTRSLGNPHCAKHRYAFEMDEDAHRGLAEALHEVSGMVVLSGYPCDLYDVELFADWERHERATHADGARARTEVVWLNPACSAALERSRGGLFAEVA